MCAAHATVRGLLHDLTEQSGMVVIDMEAGLEHLSRGTPRYVDTLLLVAEPYFKSMETAARSKAMAEELGISRILAVPNKVRGPRDAEAMRSFFAHVGLPCCVFIPADEMIVEADRLGQAPLDYDAASPAVVEIARLAEALSES
jgi:CO dehydrogenase maturation factor